MKKLNLRILSKGKKLTRDQLKQIFGGDEKLSIFREPV